MNTLHKITNLFLDQVVIDGAPKQELDNFLSQHHIKICDEYYQFLLKYGLKQDYANLTFTHFKERYLDDDLTDDGILPQNCDYLGTDFSTEALCLHHADKKIYIFGYGQIDEPYYYGSLQALLFCYLFRKISIQECFDDIRQNIKIDNKEAFIQSYLPHEIKDIYVYKRYFFKDNTLVVCSDEFCYYHVYQGGILNKLI